MTAKGVPDSTGLAGFREVRQLPYAAAQAVAGTLEPGVTEKQAARRLREYLVERGVQDWFHPPFAWFWLDDDLPHMRRWHRVAA